MESRTPDTSRLEKNGRDYKHFTTPLSSQPSKDVIQIPDDDDLKPPRTAPPKTPTPISSKPRNVSGTSLVILCQNSQISIVKGFLPF